jgi:hypothetical protein
MPSDGSMKATASTSVQMRQRKGEASSSFAVLLFVLDVLEEGRSSSPPPATQHCLCNTSIATIIASCCRLLQVNLVTTSFSSREDTSNALTVGVSGMIPSDLTVSLSMRKGDVEALLRSLDVRDFPPLPSSQTLTELIVSLRRIE